MSDTAKKQRSKIKAFTSVPMATAVIAALGMSTAHAQGNDGTDNGQTDSLGRVAIADTHPAWAVPATEKAAVPATQTIKTRVFLAGQNADGLSALAQSITDPASPNYHKYLTPAQVQSQFGATAEQIKTVTDWASGAGLKVASIGDQYVDLEGSAAVVQAAFGTTLANYTAPDGQAHYAPSAEARVPAKVAASIAGISGLYDTPTVNKPASMVSPAAGKGTAAGAATAKSSAAGAKPAGSPLDNPYCSAYWGQNSYGGYLEPICGYDSAQLRGGYGFAGSGLTGKGATVAVIDAYMSPSMASDAAAYNSALGQQQFRAGQYREVGNPAAFNSQADCGPEGWNREESLDVEAVHNMAPDANIVYVAANSCHDNDLMAAYSYVVNTHAADIVSGSVDGPMHTSNGWNQDPATRAAYDRIFMRGALEGIGFSFATGDCGDNDPANAASGGNCWSQSAGRQTAWPSSSAWVTSVGGTSLAVGSSNNYIGEETWGDWRTGTLTPAQAPHASTVFDGGGGGGTSVDVPQPFYQRNVPASMSQTAPNGAHLAHPMRVTPDVAMDASPMTGMAVYDTIGGDGWQPVGGTSLATPLFAGVEALQMQAHGGVAPGFENGTIYANANKFHDVLPGSTTVFVRDSSGTSGKAYVMGEDTSLPAAPGYDEATGNGSPTLGFVQAGYDANREERIAGADRYQTGIQISQQQYGNGSANAVVLAVGTNFPDALAGVPLAKKVGGPLLLTPGTASDPQVVAEIHRVLKPGGTVYVLGGTSAISPAVVNGLGLPPRQIQRIGGVDRYDTALKIAGVLGNPAHVVLATGTGFADALAAGPYASTVFADNGTPAAILLTNDKVMNPAVAAYAHNAKSVAAVGAQAVTAAKNAHLPNVTGFAGYDRFDTAAQVAGTFHGEHIAGVATGLQFADALTGAAQLAQAGGPLVLTNVNVLPGYTAAALHGIGASLGGSGLLEIFGGPVAISDATKFAIGAAANAIPEN